MSDTKGVEAVDRALKILDCFDADTPQISLAELSRRTTFYKSTILRLAVSLEKFGYLKRDASGQFRLGPTTWRLGACYRQSFDLADILRPELKALCEATRETASFYIREGNSRICLYRAEPDRAIRHSIVEGARMPLDRGASGKILLAYSDCSAGQPTGLQTDGHAVSLGERDPEVAAISVPVIARSGRLVGALSVSGLITRFGEDRQEALVAALQDSARRLSGQISN